MNNDDDDDEDRRAIADRTLLFDNSSMINMCILNVLVGGGDCNALYLLLYFCDADCSIEFSKVCRQGARLLDSRRHWLCAGMVETRLFPRRRVALVPVNLQIFADVFLCVSQCPCLAGTRGGARGEAPIKYRFVL
jgi:hypothetical protein